MMLPMIPWSYPNSRKALAEQQVIAHESAVPFRPKNGLLDGDILRVAAWCEF